MSSATKKKEPHTRRWWISWYEPVGADQDFRPLKWPLSGGVIAYWCSGWKGDLSAATLCGVVDAGTEIGAYEAIKAQGWKPSEWRFVEEKPADWMPPRDRFPHDDDRAGKRS